MGWGGVGTVNVGVHVHTWYAAGTLLVCSCAHMVRCWYAAGVFMCTHGTLLVRCWCVHVYTWYAAGTQLVCSCVHMVRCWYAAGVFMCTHGTLLVCHVQRCYARLPFSIRHHLLQILREFTYHMVNNESSSLPFFGELDGPNSFYDRKETHELRYQMKKTSHDAKETEPTL